MRNQVHKARLGTLRAGETHSLKLAGYVNGIVVGHSGDEVDYPTKH
jgi:hypothetical protein